MEPSFVSGVLKALACDLKSIDELPAPLMASLAGGAVREANFSFNALTGDGLSGLSVFSSHLETLVLDNNELTSLASLPSLPLVETLWLNNNNLADIESVVTVLGKMCPCIKYLSLLRNPCCPNDLMGRDEAEYRRYRLFLRYALPSLTTLDSARITVEEAEEAVKFGRFTRTTVLKVRSDEASSSSLHQHDDQEASEDLFERHSSAALLGSESSFSSSSFTVISEKKRENRTGKLCEGNRFIKDDVL